MRTPIKAKREFFTIKFGVRYYTPANVYERIYATWDSLINKLFFRVFLLKDKLRYKKKQRAMSKTSTISVQTESCLAEKRPEASAAPPSGDHAPEGGPVVQLNKISTGGD